ncbi:L-xylulose reductase-like protein [Leptotrombidium deliense]|uniref:L-xylulose reductase-like protein n=1 Tax=Leptotrombidium deliense TaxID=299467 RepID=A0A443RXN6_9ACAR|nr:L-xylulose reductase-like protein [Leptotrombidium deliense]
MNINFQQKRALVTGAGKGIGRALVKKLVECDAKVIAVSKTKETLDSLKSELPQIETYVIDISDWNATKKLIEQIGPVDLLVINAAYAESTPIGNITEDCFDK